MAELSATESELLKAFEHYFNVFLRERDPLAAAALASDAITGFGTGAEESCYSIDKALHLYQRDVAQVPTPIEYTLHKSQASAINATTGVVMGQMDWHLVIRQRKVTLYGVRATLVMERQIDGWKVVHKHLSQPTSAHGPDEAYPLREIEAESMVLERLVVQRTQDLEAAHREMQRLAATDPLTGLYNRMKTDDVLDIELERQNRSDSPLTVILMDIDDFKPVNDQHGHRKGDEILVRFAELLKGRCRKTDCVGRWGGEEFLIVCPDTSLGSAQQLAENLRHTVAEYDFNLQQPLTVSLGVASYQRGDTREALIERADMALYTAKDAGRNRVQSAN